MDFITLGISHKLNTIIGHQNIITPTKIQQLTIPILLTRKDMIASSKTGSGKTLAYLLPTVQNLLMNKPFLKKDPRALILAPTRELAKQIFTQVQFLINGTRLQSELIIGGIDFNKQAKKLALHPHIIVSTPGRLHDHIQHHHLHLDGLEVLILDEADRIFELGFKKDLEIIHHRASHRKRQTILFSATLAHIQDTLPIDNLLQNPKKITVHTENQISSQIDHKFIYTDGFEHKKLLLQAILKKDTFNRIIIFTATKKETVTLTEYLLTMDYKVDNLSSDLTQTVRLDIITQFIKNNIQILITTDISSRGLDLPYIDLVINFDLPRLPQEYIHRIGRTGRVEQTGTAISFVSHFDFDAFIKLEQLLDEKLEFMTIPEHVAKFTGNRIENKNKKKQENTKKTIKKQKTTKKKIKKKIEYTKEDIGIQPITKSKIKKSPSN